MAIGRDYEAHLDDSSQAGKCRRHMQPFCLHRCCVHVGLIGDVVEDLEFRLWGQLQTDVTHQDADNGKGTCGAPPSQQKSEVCSVPSLYQQPSLSCHRHFPRSYTSLLTLSHWTPTPNASGRAWIRNHGPRPGSFAPSHSPLDNIPAESSHFANQFGCIAYGISCSVTLCPPSQEGVVLRAHMGVTISPRSLRT